MIRREANQAYPEHERLKAVSVQSQAIGEFLDWLQTRGLFIAGYYRDARGERMDDILPSADSIPDHLAKFFEIDQTKLENEKRAMLKMLRAEHTGQQLLDVRL